MSAAPQLPSASHARVVTRFPGMDGFRALAALAIVAFHAYLATGWATAGSPTGQAFLDQLPNGVDGAFRNLTLRTNVFFVLSGMLLGLPFVRWLLIDAERRPGLRRFAIRRVRRIWPLYLVLMLLAAATVSINQTSVQQVVVNALLLQNIAPGGVHLLPVTWTLTVEVGFYILMPLTLIVIAPFVRRLTSLSARVGVLVAVCSIGFVIPTLVRRDPQLSIAGLEPRVTVLGYLDNFAAGLLAAVIIVAALTGPGATAQLVRRIPAGAWTSTGSILVLAGLVGRWRGLEPGRFVTSTWWWVAPVALGIACWLLAVALRPDRSLLARVVSSPILLAVGQISYGIFLWHYIVLHWFSIAGVTRDGGVGAVMLNILLVLAVTIPLAWASWHLVEKPFLDGRITLPRPRMPAHAFRLGPVVAAPLTRIPTVASEPVRSDVSATLAGTSHSEHSP